MSGPADDPRDAAHPWAASAPAYALGALDPDERAAFAAHLAGCADCRAEVRAYEEVATLLAAAVPPVAPPPALRARVVDAARAAGAPAASGPARPAAAPDMLAAARAARDARRPHRAAGARWLPWLAAALALVAALGAGGRWRGERAARLAAEGALARALAAQRDSLAGALAARDSLLAALLDPDVQVARLAATGAAPSVRVHWQRRGGVVVLTAAALPVPAAGRTYQLWGIDRGGAPQGLGTFVPAADGGARVVLRVPTGAAMDVVAITEEPAGGSPRPTGAPILSGTLQGE